MKVLPHSLEAEQAILGAIIQYPESLPKVKKTLDPSDFYHESHTLIYDAALSVENLDYVVLMNELEKRNQLNEVGGSGYLLLLIDNILTSVGIEEHAKIVKTFSKQRKIINLCSQSAEKAFSGHEEVENILSDLKSGIHNIETDQPIDYTPNRQILANRLDIIEARSKGEQPGYMTGIQKLDNRIYGLWPSCTYVLQAKSQSGKSSLALNIGDNVAEAYPGYIVLYFVLESSKEYLNDRRLSRRTQIPLTRLQLGRIYDEHEWECLTKACNELPENILFIDDPRFFVFEKLSAYVESFAMENQVSLVIIDFLQLIRSSKSFKNRHLELSHVATQINWLAKTIKAPVLYLSQINKEGATKESGDIYNAADVVLWLHREKDEQDATVEGAKGRDIQAPFWVHLTFERNTQTWKS